MDHLSRFQHPAEIASPLRVTDQKLLLSGLLRGSRIHACPCLTSSVAPTVQGLCGETAYGLRVRRARVQTHGATRAGQGLSSTAGPRDTPVIGAGSCGVAR